MKPRQEIRPLSWGSGALSREPEATGAPALSPSDRLLLLIVLLVYLFSAKGYVQVSDTMFSVKTAEAILTSGRMDVPPEDSYTFTAANGLSYSKYGIGLPLCFLPLVAAAHGLALLTGLPSSELTGFLVSFVSIPFALLSLVMFRLLLRCFGTPDAPARWLMLGLGLGTLCWRYAGYGLSESMQMGLLMLAIYGVVRGSKGHVAAGGLGFAVLVLVKLVYAAYLPIFLAYLWIAHGERRRRMGHAALFVFPVLLTLGLVAWLNVVRFGNVFETGYGKEVVEFFPAHLWYTIPSLLFSLDKGLLVFCPVVILGLLGWRTFAREHPREALLCGAVAVLGMLVAGSWHSWAGGWAWGPRLLVPAIPLWLLPAAFWRGWKSPQTRRSAAVALILLSVLLQIPGNLVKDQEIHHIRYVMLTPEEQASFPRDFTAVYVLLWHKLSVGNEVYSTSEFGLDNDRTLDLRARESFAGFNLWTEFAARRLRAPMLRWLPLLGLLAAGYLALRLRRGISSPVMRLGMLHGGTPSFALGGHRRHG